MSLAEALPCPAMWEPTVTDRVMMQSRPPGIPVMHQHWNRLLFMHWPVASSALRPLVPEPLEIDTHGGMAWIGVTPFTMCGVRPSFLPALPLLSSSHELNVRTYVHYQGIPGIWFLSLDASNPFAVAGARWAYSLPYFRARQSLRQEGQCVRFTSRRTHVGVPGAELDVEWKTGDVWPTLDPEGLDFFLIERYCLYSSSQGRLKRARIHHAPWPLKQAKLKRFRSSMLQSHSLSDTGPPALLHAQSAPLHVEVWPSQAVDDH